MAVAEFCPNAASLVKGFNKDGRFQAYVAPDGYYDYCTLLGFDFYTTLGSYDKEETNEIYQILHRAYIEWFVADLIELKNPDQKL